MSLANDPAPRTSWATHTLVALGFLALSLWTQRVILGAPGTMLPYPAAMAGRKTATLYQADQRFVVAAIIDTSHKALTDFASIAGFGNCFPLKRPFTLGEHMFGESLLALVPYAATGDPILSYNVVVLLALWIPAMAMYALAFHFTRSPAASAVAGMLFAFHPARVLNPAHPFVHGNLWTPLALLFAHRLFTKRRWRDALGLTLFICLQLLESFYQVLGLTLFGGVYGLAVLLHYRRHVVEILPKLAVVALLCGATAWLVLGPYLETRATWNLLQGRSRPLLLLARDYLPTQPGSVGYAAFVLAALGLVDRARRRRQVEGQDPRLPLLLAGFLVLVSTLWGIDVPLTGWRLPSPLLALGDWIPGLDAVRVLRALRFGVYLVTAFFAAYGVLFLTGRLRPGPRRVTAALLIVLILAEYYLPAPLLPLPRRVNELAAYRGRPGVKLIRLAREAPAGAVLDLPLRFDRGSKPLQVIPSYLMLSAYHHRPVAACYNSFRAPLQGDVEELARRLPERAAADALFALGFRSLLVHDDRLSAVQRRRLAPLLNDETRTEEIGSADRVRLYRLKSPFAVTRDLSPLAAVLEPPTAAPEHAAVRAALADVPADPPAEVSPPSATLDFRFRNRAEQSYRHPTFEPVRLVARWRAPDGRVLATSAARGLLPIALAPGEGALRPLHVEVPPAATSGPHRVEITLPDAPAEVLAARDVEVRKAPTGPVEPRGRRISQEHVSGG